MMARDKLLLSAVLLALGAILFGSAVLIAPVWQPGGQAVPYTAAAQAASAPVDINTATAEELTVLPGIGEAKAAAIVAYREENGPFAALSDVAQVSGVSEKMIEGWAGLAAAN